MTSYSSKCNCQLLTHNVNTETYFTIVIKENLMKLFSTNLSNNLWFYPNTFNVLKYFLKKLHQETSVNNFWKPSRSHNLHNKCSMYMLSYLGKADELSLLDTGLLPYWIVESIQILNLKLGIKTKVLNSLNTDFQIGFFFISPKSGLISYGFSLWHPFLEI